MEICKSRTTRVVYVFSVVILCAGSKKGASTSEASFREWCELTGIHLGPVSFVSTAGDDNDRLTTATQDLKEGDVVFSIPVNAVINVEHALSDPVLGDLFSSPSADELTELEIMGGYLVHEKFKRADSRWQQYLDFLPESFPTTPAFFDDEAEKHFNGLLIGPLVSNRRADTAHSYKRVKKLVQKSRYYAKRRLTETSFAWGVTALRSRGHVVAIKDGRDGSWQHAMCMVPCADMLNMAIEEGADNVACATDASKGTALSDQRFVCRATRAISAGEELLSKYISDPQRRTNSLLLLDYGFVPENNTNKRAEFAAPQPTDKDVDEGTHSVADVRWQPFALLHDSSVDAQRSATTKALALHLISHVLPRRLVLDASVWEQSEDAFVWGFLFYFRACALQDEDVEAVVQGHNNGSGENMWMQILRGTDGLYNVTASRDHERRALELAMTFLEHAELRRKTVVDMGHCDAQDETRNCDPPPNDGEVTSAAAQIRLYRKRIARTEQVAVDMALVHVRRRLEVLQ
eukprot:m.274379 g.274379  ORF g.274379 m.274379 type:complete len:519 (-) comp19761_c0_seq2:296-1852(-)